MKRIGRVLAVVALVLPFTFSGATLVTAGGCSGSSDTQGKGTGEIDKAAQEKMKEYIAKREPMNAKKKK
jgi:hypothetical protein